MIKGAIFGRLQQRRYLIVILLKQILVSLSLNVRLTVEGIAQILLNRNFLLTISARILDFVLCMSQFY